jgi:hypothetical protein
MVGARKNTPKRKPHQGLGNGVLRGDGLVSAPNSALELVPCSDYRIISGLSRSPSGSW